MIVNGYEIDTREREIVIFSYIYLNRITINFTNNTQLVQFLRMFVPNIQNFRHNYKIRKVDRLNVYSFYNDSLVQNYKLLNKLRLDHRPLAYDFNGYFKKHKTSSPVKIDDLSNLDVSIDYFLNTAKYYHIIQPGGASAIIVGSNTT